MKLFTSGVSSTELVKRETGVNPVRTRHCNERARVLMTYATGKNRKLRLNADIVFDRTGKAYMCVNISKSGDLPEIGMKELILSNATSNWQEEEK